MITRIVLINIICISAVYSQSALVLTPEQDNTLYEDTNGSLSNGRGAHIFTGRTNGGSERRAVISFDFEALPAGAVLQQVSLRLHMSRSISPADTIDLYRLTKGWGEKESDAGGEEGSGAASAPGDATWIHTYFDSVLWTVPGGDFIANSSASTVVADTGYYQWQNSVKMIEDIQFWLAEPDSNYGWILVSRSSNGPSAKRFGSREQEISAFQPTLTIQYSEITSVADEPSLPLSFNLSQNYPNPFNPSTEIQYQLAGDSGPVPVKLSILNLLGQSVRRLVNERQSAGTYSVTWNGKNDAGVTLPGGTYFYQLQSGSFQTVRIMTLIK